MGKRVMVMEVSGKRIRGRPKRKWSDNMMWDEPKYTHLQRTLCIRRRDCQRVALMNVGTLTEIRGDSINSDTDGQKSGSYRRGWVGYFEGKQMPMRFDDGLCE